ncbi:hypothetical protein ACWGJX_38935 [Streptomyces sp. NPDC054775]
MAELNVLIWSHHDELPESRLEALEEIDPGWCPAWDIGWQRCFRLTRTHLEAGGQLAAGGGELVVQGEDLGAWTTAQRLGWDKLLPAQQWLLDSVLGLEPTGEDERPARQTQDAKWVINVAAARQFHAREGHLTVPRKHVEEVDPRRYGSAAFWTTPVAGPRNSPNSGEPTSISSACAGSR